MTWPLCPFGSSVDAFRRCSGYRPTVWNIVHYDRMSSDGDVVSYVDAAEDGCSGHDFHIIADSGAPSFAIADGYELQTIEVAAYRLGVEIGGIAVLKVGSRSYPRAPYI